MPQQHAIYIAFAFALGACVGSFLNVVVWRLPRVEHKEGEGLLRSFYRSWQALSWPPSRCPKCGNTLKWYDNVPVLGWLRLRGRCRFCREPISSRYPIVEAITGGIFVLYYVLFFVFQVGPCAGSGGSVGGPAGAGLAVPRDLWLYLLYMSLLAALLAASLIDAELFVIPMEIPYAMAVVGLVVHAVFDRPGLPGSLNLVGPAGEPNPANALAAGGAAGLAVSLVLFKLKYIPISFPQGEPILEAERPALEEEVRRAKDEGLVLDYQAELPPPYTKRQIRAEIRKEIRFLLPPMALAVGWMLLAERVPAVGRAWASWTASPHVTGLLGAVLGALVAAWLIWAVRILGTLLFGRVAMGLGDVHLMFGIGAVIGAGASVIAFFLAPFFGIALAVYLLLTGKRRELPYGPYLSLGTAAVMLFYCPIADYLRPGLQAMMYFATRQ
jgi:leader peptidase (prepilin peptidase)/N-methyltransferase